MRVQSCFLLALLLGGSLLSAEILYSVTDLGTLGRANFTVSNSSGYGINNAGQVVGFSSTSTGTSHAFLYSNGQMTDLGALPGYFRSWGSGINNAGQVTGTFSTYTASGTDPSHAFLYSNGQMTDLGTLGGRDSYGSGINNAGQITGSSSTLNGFSHAFLYSLGQMTDLGTLGGRSSLGNGINNTGQVVGRADTSSTSISGNPHAFLYSNGQVRDLNDLIDPTLGLELLEGTAINDNGQILARTTSSYTYLLTPVPEPSPLALFGVALLGYGVWARTRKQ
jgi:probable HAF family extracellular repeat protein